MLGWWLLAALHLQGRGGQVLRAVCASLMRMAAASLTSG